MKSVSITSRSLTGNNTPPEWEDFAAAARRPIEQHIRNSFIKTYRPGLDDAKYRSFDTMADYRQWGRDNVPAWLGYNRD